MISTFFVGLMAIAFFMLFRKFKFQQNNNDTNSSDMFPPSPSTSLSRKFKFQQNNNDTNSSDMFPPSPSTSLSRNFKFQQNNNDTNSSDMFPPSPSTSLSRNFKHDVFPSFHGADVRENILSHMLASFKRKGISPFIDEGIERGKSIGPELIKAIRGSRIAIVLLSKDYASSSWCLDELAEIIKCREVLGQIVMPIFFKVDPTDVKKQTGDFGAAFKETCKGKTKEHLGRWRRALDDVAPIAGFHSSNWANEAAMIEKITTDVSNILTNSMPSGDFELYVGMRAHMGRMESLLCLDLDEVRMIGIWGLSGIGKTTIARVVFSQLSSLFQHGTVMVNIKGCYPRPGLDECTAQLHLQSQMLSQIFQKHIEISHLGAAKERLQDRKVLLVIDGVDRLGQLHALAKEISWFGFGSRIIVTTEDRSILNAHGINHIYKVKFPSSDEAFQIFCMHAFRQKHPPDDGFEELTSKVLNFAGELPLGLKVLGSALWGKSKQKWEMLLPRLKTCLDGEIENILKFSYDSLCDEDQHIFLCIACFFNYQIVHKVAELLAEQFTNVKLGLQNLAEKSLISVYQFGRIEMHALLVQVGKKISRSEFLDNARDVSKILREDTTDSSHPIAINVELSNRPEDKLNISISDKTLQRISDLQFVRVLSFQLPTCEMLQWQSLIFHSQKIRSLNWSHFQNICLPSTFNPVMLVELVLRFSMLQMLWKGFKKLGKLKWMDLSSSRYLKELPDLSTATNLEELFLLHCSSLKELPNLSTTTKLTKLILGHCSSLVKLPSSIGDLSNLEELDLSNCSGLVELPSYIGTATKLQRLDLSGCSKLVNLPSSVGDLISLEEFDLSNCSSLLKLPFSIGKLQKLQKLTMCGCSKLEALPTNINLISLDVLDLTNCSQLKSFPEISTNIVDLNLKGTAIEDIPLTITSWPRLHKLNLQDCHRLNQEARDLIMRTSTRNYAVLPGTEVPACFYYRATAGGTLTVNFYEMSPLPSYLRFNACITLVEGKSGEETSDYEKSKYVKINMMARRNDQMVSCGSSNHLIGDCLIEQHLYIIEVVAEDVTSAELTFKFNIESSNWKIRKCGLMLT